MTKQIQSSYHSKTGYWCVSTYPKWIALLRDGKPFRKFIKAELRDGGKKHPPQEMRELVDRLNKELELGGVVTEHKAATVGALLDAYVQVMEVRYEKKIIVFSHLRAMKQLSNRWKEMTAPDGVGTLDDFPCKDLSKEMIAGTKVSEGKAGLIDNLVHHRNGKPLCDKTIKTYITCLKQAYDLAPEMGWAQHNPASNIHLEKPKWDKSEDELRLSNRKPTVAQICKVMDAALAMDVTEGSNTMRWCDGLAVSFAALTGVRFGEQAALRWQDITWPSTPGGEGQVCIAIAQRVGPNDPDSATREIHVGGTKNTRDNKIKPPRYLPLDGELVALLREWKMVSPRSKDTDLIFLFNEKYKGRNYRGKPIRYQPDGRVETSKRWREDVLHPACDQIGMERIRWHDLRHYYASMLIDEFGGDYATIQRRMGHTKVSFTIERYGNWVDQTQREAGSATRMLEARQAARAGAY